MRDGKHKVMDAKTSVDDDDDLLKMSFLSYLFDMYSLPDDLTLRLPKTGKAGLEEDARMMRSYFQGL